MTDRGARTSGQPLVARLLYPVRRALAPAALELAEQVQDLVGRVEDLAADVSRLRDENGRLQARGDELERRLGVQDGRIADMHEQVLEGRRLNVRIAELTDVVTELVLPLHDREIHPGALQGLRPDTV